jgi:hypothetical protein
LRYSVTVTKIGFMQRATGRNRDRAARRPALIGRLGPTSDLILVLEDGRRWRCTLKNSSGDLLDDIRRMAARAQSV